MTRASHRRLRRALGVVACLPLLLALAACGGDEAEPDASEESTSTPSEATDQPSESASATDSTSAATGDPAPSDDRPFGPDCGRFKTNSGVGPADYKREMDFGTFFMMFNREVGDGVALLNRSDLMRLTDTTYFLPTNDAIDLLNQDQSGDLLFDDQKRLQIMGRHVIEGSLAPSALAGEHQTANGGSLEVSVDGDDVRVGLQRAPVLCGNIELEQGVRVYVIDQVLIS